MGKSAAGSEAPLSRIGSVAGWASWFGETRWAEQLRTPRSLVCSSFE